MLPASAVVRSVTQPGASLAAHALNPETRSRVRDGNWTHVVMQEQSQKLATGDVGFERAAVWPWAWILTQDAGLNVTTVWYETPAHLGGNGVSDTYEAMQARVAGGYAALDAEIRARGHSKSVVAPVGRAFTNDPKLYVDSTHPSVRGTYLASLVIAKTITGGKIRKRPPPHNSSPPP